MKISKLSDISCNCYTPNRLYNKYLDRHMVVPCRKCEACQKSVSNRLVSRCEMLRQNSEMCLFVTLTYDNEHIPTAYFTEDFAVVRYWSALHRCHECEVVRGSEYSHVVSSLSELDARLLREGAPSTVDGASFAPFCFSVLRKVDLQLFFKRFRKLFNYAFPTSSFKYFACGEYGSKTFRAHFHALIYLDNTVSFSKLQDILRMSWKFGLCDIQSVEKSASSYVASYTNAFGSLPHFLTDIKAFKPFRCQSNGNIFEMFPEEEDKFFKENYFSFPYTVPKQTKDGVVLRSMSHSMRVHFYPVCSGFYVIDDAEKFFRLSEYSLQREVQGREDPVFTRYCKLPDGTEESITFPYSVIYDLRKKFDNPTKKSDYWLDNRDFTDIYNSKRIYDISQKVCKSPYEVVRYIISYYVGSPFQQVPYVGDNLLTNGRDKPNSNFQLSLLRSQYEAFELCETDEDVRYLYGFFDGSTLDWSLADVRRYSLDTEQLFSSHSVTRPRELVASLARQAFVNHIKHKDRNSYLQLLNK